MQVLADGRIRRTSGEWEKIIARHRKCSLPIAAFCEREEISTSAFASWKRKLSGGRKKSPSFVELTRPSPNPAVEPAATSISQAGTAFELVLPGGVTLRWRG
jgi:hypothetical protein